jgi:threonine-phosphate decarboxylase
MSAHGDTFARDVHLRSGLDVVPQLDRVHGGDGERWARRAGIDAGAILDFSASINPLGPPAAARKAFRSSYSAISRYPDPYGEALKAALARAHRMDLAEVLLGNGSTQLIYLLCTALRPRHALIVSPAFSEYANALALAGAKISYFPLQADEEFSFSPERLAASWDRDCDMVFLTTPNSVTGGLVPRRAIEQVADLARTKNTLLVIDEAFIDFVEEKSVKDLVRDNPYLVVLRSLTKFYSLPGLRLGYLLGQTGRISQLAACQEPWSINAPALSVACACLNDSSFAAKTKRWLARERNFLPARLGTIEGLRVFPSDANFLLGRIENPAVGALQFQKFLLRKQILIRACGSFVGLDDRYFRVAVRRRQDNLRLIAAIEAWTPLSVR